MTTRTHLIAKTHDNKTSHPLVGQLFIKPSGTGAEISENGGPILVFEQDGVVTVKIENDVSGVNFNGHPVKKGGIYFLELGDTVTCKETVISIIEVDIIETATSINVDSLDEIKLENTETMPDTNPQVFSDQTLQNDRETKLEKKEPKEVHHENHDDDLGFSVDTEVIKTAELNAPIKKKVKEQKQNQEITRTSIDIGELLQTQKKQTRKEKLDKLDEEDESDPKVVAKKKKANQVKKMEIKTKRSDSIETTRRVGPFTRLFSIIAGFSLTMALYHFVDAATLNEITSKIITLVNTNIPQAKTLLKDYQDLLEQTISVLLIYFGINFISNIIFSTSIPLFLVGATTEGTFIRKRIKALLRFPLEVISFFLPIFDLPVLIGKRSFKEFITKTQIQYRQRILRLTAIPLLLIFSLLPHFETLIRAKIEKKPEISIITSTMFTKEKSVKHSVLMVSRGIELNYEIAGSSTPKMNFFLINKTDGKTIAFRELRSIKYSLMKSVKDEIPFFSQFYPNLSAKIEGDTPSDLTGLREEVLNFIKSGEFTICGKPEYLSQLNILTTNTASNFLRSNNILFEKIYKTTEETRYYEYKGELSLLAITNDEIKILAVDSNIEKPWPYLSQIALSFNGHGKHEEIDSIFRDPALFSSQKTIIQERLNNIKSALTRNSDQSNSIFFEKFVKALYEQTPQELTEFQAYLNSLL
ncbi:hypothetical protein [Bacteriovorax sp. Seq25_V]|uniref:hypothetical protein n=1 Tax=Bacteriovorax sp. Seq25_V TaxID=1201288 RepID=UPI00038A43FF|nr:hypothetical protein [Bacteriovorax sp. Seq25_V]EQC43723.1 hypothetical protein M900_1236 [Bacteriovorax sp. Seq25_V]